MVKKRMAGRGGILLVLALSTAGAVAGREAELEARIEMLEHKLLELDRRVQALEASTGVVVPGSGEPSPGTSPGEWKDPGNWSNLEGRMTQDEVAELLGRPVETKIVGKFEYWYYGEHKVVFYLGRVDSWLGP